MAYKKKRRRVEFKYEFDRLGKQKMEQVYDILFSKVLQKYEDDMKQLIQRGKKR